MPRVAGTEGRRGREGPAANWSALAQLEAHDLDPPLLGLTLQEKLEIQVFTSIFECQFKASHTQSCKKAKIHWGAGFGPSAAASDVCPEDKGVFNPLLGCNVSSWPHMGWPPPPETPVGPGGPRDALLLSSF